MTDNQKRLETSREIWDEAAATFDNEPDHGLRNPTVRAAWKALLKKYISHSHLEILDIGCGTASLSILLAELGFSVTGSDLSPKMIKLAQNKAEKANHKITFHVMDAAFPEFPPHTFDAIVCRHLLWALPEPAQVLQRWVNLLKPDGQIFLIEGFWHTGAGLHAQDIVKMMPASMGNILVEDLSQQTEYWGGAVTDERYLVRATLSH